MPDPVGFPIGHALVAIPFNKCANRHLVERARICELAKLCLGSRFIQLASGLCRGGESLLHSTSIDYLTGHVLLWATIVYTAR
ncbi:hypothetical protein AA14337_2547 [Acetobacter malorum DSM 14337]|uniref:Transposase n=1 Tax=Acetobacter malorum DSM 14337 TaxID=1307910 RepID=A0ABQ0PWC6_9PROT|nr:hypothetical protein AD930_09520 [Acetobacter malorum]GBQ83261.1 hypothetical protein AA14337_2547 [Acetobacter malorum DSM 14337]